jgi:hypothetical protein
VDFTDLKDYVSLSKDAVELMRTVYRALPRGQSGIKPKQL